MATKVCLADVSTSSFDTGNLPPKVVTRDYTIWVDPADGSNDPKNYRYVAESALLSSLDCPSVDWNYGGLFRKNVTVSQVGSLEDQFTGVVTWEQFREPGEDTEFFSGSITTVSERQMVAYQRIASVTYPGRIVTDAFGTLIGVTPGDGGEVQGVEVNVPVLSFTLKKRYASGTFTISFMQQAYQYVGKPNDRTWRGFAAGEVMLMGIDGDDSSTEYDDITYSFEARPTVPSFDLPTLEPTTAPDAISEVNITVPAKTGFDYMWMITRPQEMPASGGENIIVDVAQDVYIDRLTAFVNLDNLVPG